jgi:hypothetical protein
MTPESRHQCFIYDGAPSEQLPLLAAMIQRRLDEGYRCLYLNSLPMVAGMRSYLSAMGLDVEKEIAQARLILSSDPVAAADGSFDVGLMLNKLEDALDQALSDGYKGLWATGDMTWEFGSEKNLEKLMEYELGLEALIRKRQALCGICQYHQGSLPREITRQGLLTHRTIFINETLSRINPHYLPSGLPPGRPLATHLELDETITALCELQKKKS